MIDIGIKVLILFVVGIIMVLTLPVTVWFDKKFINRHSKIAYAQICMGELFTFFIGIVLGFVVAIA